MNSGMRLIRVEKQQFTAGMLDAELWEITRDEWNRRCAENGAPVTTMVTGYGETSSR